MAIKLRQESVVTEEDARKQYIEQHKGFVGKVETAIRQLCAEHRKAFEAWLFQDRKRYIQEFLDNRRPNQTAFDFKLGVLSAAMRDRESNRSLPI